MSEFANTPAPVEKKGITADELAIIKATVPILEVGGEALTKHFYGIMLTEHPEVVPFFNKAHQKSGDQPRALANAVLMYAKNIEKLQNLGGLVNQIIHKHVALDINPAHYAVVGSCLLRAIREVLGAEVATDAVIAAWATAYGMLADILIGAEKGLMDAKAAAPGGWMHDRAFVVTEKVTETPHITSFLLEPADKQSVMAHEAGQYLGLHLTVNGDEVRRNYSISSVTNGKTYRITVKRETDGVVSNYLHDHVQVGSTLMVMPPAGEFTLKNAAADKPVVFLTAGVGITPAMAMLQDILSNPHTVSRDVRFIHCARTGAEQVFRTAVAELTAAHTTSKVQQHWYSRDGTEHPRLSAAQLGEWLPTDRDVEVFLLGSKSFMKDMKKNLIDLAVPAAQIHYEFFGPAANID